jgi:hypothetical protein
MAAMRMTTRTNQGAATPNCHRRTINLWPARALLCGNPKTLLNLISVLTDGVFEAGRQSSWRSGLQLAIDYNEGGAVARDFG